MVAGAAGGKNGNKPKLSLAEQVHTYIHVCIFSMRSVSIDCIFDDHEVCVFCAYLLVYVCMFVNV